MTDQPTICTIVSKNYLAYARCLTDSFLEYHPEGRVFTLLVDEMDGAFDPERERFITIMAKDLGIPQFEQMAFRYFVHELNTAVKPFLLEYLFNNYGCRKLCYFDPDIQFYQRIDDIYRLLNSYGFLLLPHLTDFLEDEFLPNEVSILTGGIYNLGFIGLAQHEKLMPFLHWWQRKMKKYCTGEVEKGLFLDQRWIDLVPGLFESVYIHRDPGYNVAYWNLNHRHIEATGTGYTVNGVPLKFYHFSGFDFDNVEIIARYQNRYTLSRLEHLAPLYHAYRDKLIAHDHVRLRQLPYAYSNFDNGVFIPGLARYLWRTVEDKEGYRWPNPFATDQPDSFINWLNEPVDNAGTGQPLVTQLAMELYRRQPDLQVAFSDVLGRHRQVFSRWFVRQAREENHIDDFFIEPMRASLARAVKPGRQDDEAIPPALLAPERQLPRSARTYLAIRDFLNNAGVGQRVRAIVGPERVLGVRQLFFRGRGQQEQPSPSLNSSPPVLPVSTGRPAKTTPHYLSPGLNVIGYLKDETGVGEVARSILKALHKTGFAVAQTSIDGYIARREDHSVMDLPDGNPHSFNLLNINAEQVPYVYKKLGGDFFAGKYNIGFWFWELSKFPEAWRNSFEYFNEVWAGSSFVQGSVAAISPVPVVNVRVPITERQTGTLTRSDLGLPLDKFIFLFVFDGLSYIERKNPFDLLSAYQMAFEPHYSDTVLVIKTTNLDQNPALADLMQQKLNQVSGILIDRYMDRTELSDLFAACDSYVSLHRSEGFGMTLAETMLMGKPVIATAYSANMDFMTPANSYLVGYRLVELEQDYGPYQKGNVWAQPDVDQAAGLMRQAFQNPDEAHQKGLQARADILRDYSPEAVAKGIIKRLEVIQKFHSQI